LFLIELRLFHGLPVTIFANVYGSILLRIVDHVHDHPHPTIHLSRCPAVDTICGFRFLFEGYFEGDPGFVYTTAAFRVIECNEAAEAFKEGLALFRGNLPPEDIGERLEVYLKWPEKARNRINERFWDSNEDITAKLAEYIWANRAAFEHLP